MVGKAKVVSYGGDFEVWFVGGVFAEVGLFLWMLFSPRIPNSRTLCKFLKVLFVCHLLPPVVSCHYSYPGMLQQEVSSCCGKECESCLKSRLLVVGLTPW